MRPNRTRREYLTVAEVASIIGISPETVRRLARSGQLPATRFGKQWRFDPAVIRVTKERRETA